jgi:hypothetical protein
MRTPLCIQQSQIAPDLFLLARLVLVAPDCFRRIWQLGGLAQTLAY